VGQTREALVIIYYDLSPYPILISPYPRGLASDIAGEWQRRGVTLALNVATQGWSVLEGAFKLYQHFKLADSQKRIGANAHAAASCAVAHLAETPGGKVLIHCRGGRHRAPLVAGLILCGLGYTGVEALHLVLDRRPGAFGANQFFADYLARMPAGLAPAHGPAVQRPPHNADLIRREVATAVQQQKKLGIIQGLVP